MPRIDGNRKHGAFLPFKDMFLLIALLPHLGGAPAFDDQVNLLIHVPLWVKRTCCRHLHHVTAPTGLGAIQLDIVAFTACSFPWHQS